MRLLILLAMLVAHSANADVAPEDVPNRASANGCTQKYLCNNHTGTGACTRSGDEIVYDAFGMNNWMIDFTESTGTFTCELQSNFLGFDAGNTSAQVNPSSFVDSARVMHGINTIVNKIWVTCSANTTQVTAVITACPSTK